MITYLKGILSEKTPTRIVVEVAGIGHEIIIPLSTYERLPREGAEVKVLTHYHIREDAQVLYGFMSENDRRMFRLLMSVSGVGPKIAINALSGLNSSEFTRAIMERDIKRLSSISGIGKKTAERMIVELKDKISEADALAATGSTETAIEGTARDAMLALVSLGYKQEDARKAVATVVETAGGDTLSVEEIIKRALAR